MQIFVSLISHVRITQAEGRDFILSITVQVNSSCFHVTLKFIKTIRKLVNTLPGKTSIFSATSFSVADKTKKKNNKQKQKTQQNLPLAMWSMNSFHFKPHMCCYNSKAQLTNVYLPMCTMCTMIMIIPIQILVKLSGDVSDFVIK